MMKRGQRKRGEGPQSGTTQRGSQSGGCLDCVNECEVKNECRTGGRKRAGQDDVDKFDP